jgi:hypothetical protein
MARRTKPATVKDMARRRGLDISKAIHGGWYITLHGFNGLAPSPVLYCSHLFAKIRAFVKQQPIMVLRSEEGQEQEELENGN